MEERSVNEKAPKSGSTSDAAERPERKRAGEPAGDGTRPVDRRTFLRTASAAGAALGLGATPGGADGDVPEGRTASPSPDVPYLHQGIPDVLVVGAGAFGAWTSFYLRRQGLDVLMIDKYGPANSKATSGGETRGVRTGYGDRGHGELWTRWASEAIRRWREYDEEWKDRIPAPLFYTTSDLIMREEDEPFLQETRKHWDTVGVEYEVLDGDEVAYRWPAIDTEYVSVALWEKDAGVVRARRAIETVANIFQDEGGRLEIAEVRLGGRADDGSLWDVRLDSGETRRAGTYVFALGPWMPLFFPDVLGTKISIPMGHVFYYGTPAGDHRFTWPNLPSYNVPGVTGWPALPPDNRGFRVRTGGSQHPDPDTSPRWVPTDKFARPRQVLEDYFPQMGAAPLVETRTCHYESSVSRNFIIDRHPDYSNVWFAGGGSAEAFKFGPVNGEYVAQRVSGMEGDPEIAEGFRIPEEDYEGPGG